MDFEGEGQASLITSYGLSNTNKLNIELYDDKIQFVSSFNDNKTIVLIRLTLLQWRLFCDDLDIINDAMDLIALGDLFNYSLKLSRTISIEIEDLFHRVIIKNNRITDNNTEHTLFYVKERTLICVGVVIYYKEWKQLMEKIPFINSYYNFDLIIPCYARGVHINIEAENNCFYCAN